MSIPVGQPISHSKKRSVVAQILVTTGTCRTVQFYAARAHETSTSHGPLQPSPAEQFSQRERRIPLPLFGIRTVLTKPTGRRITPPCGRSSGWWSWRFLALLSPCTSDLDRAGVPRGRPLRPFAFPEPGVLQARARLREMFERAQIKMLPLANRVADQAPAVTACCNACRTCVQTNILALAFAGLTSAGALLARPARRLLNR
jgi:hypothetical protein